MDRNPLEIDAVGQKVVDAHGAGPFEGVAGREDTELPFQSGEVVEQRVDQIGVDGALDDRVALFADAGAMGGEVDVNGIPREPARLAVSLVCSCGTKEAAAGQLLRTAHLRMEGSCTGGHGRGRRQARGRDAGAGT